MDKVPQLGRILSDEGQGRDAIHIAIAPVVAGEVLNPGQRIGFVGNSYTVGVSEKVIGIVDPFLKKDVKRGERFYIFLLPNTITSLRHNWSHPEFEEEETLASMEQTFMVLRGAPESKKWIAEFADSVSSDYDEIMSGADAYVRHGEYLVRGGTFEGMGIPAEFWDHYEKVTNSLVPEDVRGSFLSCSC